MNSVISIDDTLHAKMLTIHADWSEIANRAIRHHIALLDSVRYRGGDAFEKGMATAYDWIRDDADPDLVGRFVALTGRLEELLAPSELTVAEKTYRMLYPEVTWGTAKDFWKWIMGDQVSGIKHDRFIVGFIFGVAEASK